MTKRKRSIELDKELLINEETILALKKDIEALNQEINVYKHKETS